MAGSDDKGDRVRDEFLAEAQEIIETLSRDLLLLDAGQKEGAPDPDRINDVFRGVHTLKGIAGMFGYPAVGQVAHGLEDLLDDLRLGRIELTQNVLDVLFEGVESFQRLLAESADSEESAAAHIKLGPTYSQPAKSMPAKSMPAKSMPARPERAGSLEDFDLDAGVLAVLTEYEEHRLRSNAEQGLALYRLKVRFALSSIDSALEDLKTRAKPLAEIITYLPSMGGGDGDTIELDVLLASRASYEELESALGGANATLTTVPRKDAAPTAPPPSGETADDIKLPQAPPTPGGREAAALAAAVAQEGGEQLSLRSMAKTVRVDIRKLDHLMNVVGELALVRSAVSRMTERIRRTTELRQFAIELHRINRGFERHLGDLQDGILDVRMVPLGQVFDKLARVVRQVAREHDKEIRLVVTGADTEVDKLIVEELSDPLMHIIRNAIDHGIEVPNVRELSGKSPVGTLALNAFQKGNHVLIEVEDDGTGMDSTTLLEAAVRKNVVTREVAKELGREEILNLIFAPGFSTRSEVTDLSGRGVGMDVVKTNISRLGGIVDVHSEYGTGTKFTITLPITLAIISALVVSVAKRIYAVPLNAVQEAFTLDPYWLRTVGGREVITLRGATLPICRLDRLFGLARDSVGKKYVVVTALGQRRLGFVVDELQGQQDIVIKPLGQSLSRVRGFAGATDLGDQRVALVLDTPSLLEELLAGSERTAGLGAVS